MEKVETIKACIKILEKAYDYVNDKNIRIMYETLRFVLNKEEGS